MQKYTASPMKNSANGGDAPTSVYVYRDARQIVLYVGITSRRVSRNDEHNGKEWWRFVTEQSVEHFSTRTAAMAREIELIRQFRPPFNTQHNRGYQQARSAYLSLVDLDVHGVGAARTKLELSTCIVDLRQLGGEIPLIWVGKTSDCEIEAFATLPEHEVIAERLIVPEVSVTDLSIKSHVGRVGTSRFDGGRMRMHLRRRGGWEGSRLLGARGVIKVHSMRKPVTFRLTQVRLGIDPAFAA